MRTNSGADEISFNSGQDSQGWTISKSIMLEIVEEVLRKSSKPSIGRVPNIDQLLPFVDEERRPASYFKKKIEDIQHKTIAQLEGLSLEDLKVKPSPIDVSDELVKPLRKLKEDQVSMTTDLPKDYSFETGSKAPRQQSSSKGGFMEDALRGTSRIQREQESLQQLRSCRKMDLEPPSVQPLYPPTPEYRLTSDGHPTSVSRDSRTRNSRSMEHIKVLEDQADVCTCNNHGRTSLHKCRESMRKSLETHTDLKEVREAEEEAEVGGDSQTNSSIKPSVASSFPGQVPPVFKDGKVDVQESTQSKSLFGRGRKNEPDSLPSTGNSLTKKKFTGASSSMIK